MSKDKDNKKPETTELQKPNGEKAVEPISPFGFMRRFAEDMERLFDDFYVPRFPNLFEREWFPFGKEMESIAWTPKIEVLQHNGDLTVRAELPGLTKDDVKVKLTDEALTISGERKEEKEEKRDGFYRSERSYGTFYRQVPLPPGVDIEKATATFNNGVLEVTVYVPKIEARSRTVEIKEEQPAEKSMTAAK